MTNTDLLRERIENSGLTLKYLCGKLGLTYKSLQLKISNVNEFKASEISVLSSVLNLDAGEKEAIFFACERE